MQRKERTAAQGSRGSPGRRAPQDHAMNVRLRRLHAKRVVAQKAGSGTPLPEYTFLGQPGQRPVAIHRLAEDAAPRSLLQEPAGCSGEIVFAVVPDLAADAL